MPRDLDTQPIIELVDGYAREHRCATLAWGIVLDGELATSGSFATNDVDDPGLAGLPDADTVYRIASMTKSFSAAGALWLRDHGVLQLDDPIGRHAPELRAERSPTSDAPPITIRDLLAMTSGLATDDPWADRHLDLTDDEFDAIIADGLIYGEPTGWSYEYSNFGYALLGRVVLRATGYTLQRVVSERILEPLGLTQTSWVRPTHERWARPMAVDDVVAADPWEPCGDGLIAPMGGLWTTVADLARWVTWLDDAVPPRDDPDPGPLARSSRREMQTIQRWVGFRDVRGVRLASGYGYGLRIQHDPSLGTVITHSGGLPGYGSNMRWLSGRRVAAIALANTTYAPMTELTARLLDAVHEQGFGARSRRTVSPELSDVAQRLVALINEWSDDDASALFADNVAADRPFERRRADVTATIGDGAPIAISAVQPTSDAAATVSCVDRDQRPLTLTFSLAPLRPPRIQRFGLTRPE